VAWSKLRVDWTKLRVACMRPLVVGGWLRVLANAPSGWDEALGGWKQAPRDWRKAAAYPTGKFRVAGSRRRVPGGCFRLSR